jgi:multiple sugar transport system substrate-binding protein
MRARTVVSGLAVAALTLPLAACGGGGDSASGDAKTIKIVYRNYSDFPQMDTFMKDVKKQFEAANPGITAQLTPVSSLDSDYLAKVQLMQRSPSTAPDVLFEDSFNVNADAAAGYLRPIDDYLSKWSDWNSQFIPTTKQAGRAVDGKTYAVPMGTDSRGLWFNKDIFAKAGLPTDWQPKTWNDVLDAARKIKQTQPGVEPMYLPLGKPAAEAMSMQTLEMLLYGTDTKNLYDEQAGKWVAPSKGFQDALGYVQTVMKEGLAQTAAQAEDTQWAQTQMPLLMSQGKIGFMMDGGWYARYWEDGGVAPWPEWSKTLGTTTFPTQNGQAPGKVTLSGGWTLAVGASAGNADASMKFIQTALNKENSAKIDVACSWLPVREDVKSDPALAKSDPTVPFWSSLVSFTRYRPTLAEYPQVSNAMDVAGDSVVNGGDPAQAAEQWAKDVAKAVGSDKVKTG